MSQEKQPIPSPSAPFAPGATTWRGKKWATLRASLQSTEAVWWVLLAIVWTPFGLRLTSVWSSGEEYSYGWAVPVLVIYLFRERWRTAPAAATEAGKGRGAFAVFWLGLGLLAVTTPVFEANRLWPTLQWLAIAGVLLTSVAVLARAGGWRWSFYFLFPLGFATSALVWPAMVQVPLMQSLAHWNAWLTAELLSWSGHPAVVRGNVIEIGRGLVGVDEACSGLRSLQGVWMLGLFFGELMRLSLVKRIALVAFALGIAFLGNLGRTLFLTLQIAKGGAVAGERWHDAAGNAVLVGTLGLVALIAYGLARGAPLVAVKSSSGHALMRPPTRIVVAIVCVVAAAEIGTGVWYAMHAQRAERIEWRLTNAAENWKAVEVPPRSIEILRCSSATGLSWNDSNAQRQALAFVFRWEGDSVIGEEAIYHDPSECLPLIGTQLEARLTPVTVAAAARKLTFQAYRFTAQGKTQHVFFCLWDSFRGEPLQSSSAGGEFFHYRLTRVVEGRSRADLEHLTFVLQGEENDDRARQWLQQAVDEVLVPN